MMLIAAGPSSTMNKVGRMNTIIGTVSIAGSRAAFSSARVNRAARDSADRTRNDWASGVPNLAVCCSVLTMARMASEVGAVVEIVERHPAVRQKGQLGGGDRELLGEFGKAVGEFARDPQQGRIEAEPGLGANHHQVEPVRQRQLQLLGALSGGIPSDKFWARKSRAPPRRPPAQSENRAGIGSRFNIELVHQRGRGADRRQDRAGQTRTRPSRRTSACRRGRAAAALRRRAGSAADRGG